MKRAMYIEDIEALNRKAGFYWFEPGTKRFFRSRISGVAYATMDGTRAFFVSSEQFQGSDGVRAPRRYTVRVALLKPTIDGKTAGSIDTAGEFQQYATHSGATAAAKRLAGVAA